MKTKPHTTIVTFLAAAAALAVVTPSARSQVTGEPLKLEGAWVAKVPGTPVLVTFTLSPTDSSGTNAALYGSTLIGDPTLGGAFTNAQYQTPVVGQATLTSSNSGVMTLLQYGMKTGPAGPEVVYITLDTGPFTNTAPGKVLHVHNISVYLPSQDTQGVGLPDPGQAPMGCGSLTTITTRLPLLSPCSPRPALGPLLNISRQADNSVAIAWPALATGFTLQSTPTLPSTNWAPVPGVQSNRVVVQPGDAKQFYRLEKQ